jgi:hypothetical protein
MQKQPRLTEKIKQNIEKHKPEKNSEQQMFFQYLLAQKYAHQVLK